MKRLRILHVIETLWLGGAQRLLPGLLKGLDPHAVRQSPGRAARRTVTAGVRVGVHSAHDAERASLL
jgi:hypothetical protein